MSDDAMFCSDSGKNIVHQISVTLDDLYNGATRKLAVQKNCICDRCEGTSLSLAALLRYILILCQTIVTNTLQTRTFPNILQRDYLEERGEC